MTSKPALSSRSPKACIIGAVFSFGFVCCGEALSNEPILIEVQEKQGLYSIYAEAYLSADPERVWNNLTNCGKATDFVPYLISCRILSEDKKSRWDVRENISAPPLSPKVRTVIRNEFGRHEFSYHLIGGDLKISEGTWKVMPDVRGTRIIYSARFQPPTFAPTFLMASAMRRNMSEMFGNLERLSKGRN
jgi:ribosome-associated toxin RatA of RatAB toxin-antitoxin module